MNNSVNNNDKKERKGARFNIVDAVIILLVLGCIVGIILRLDLIDKLMIKNQMAPHEISFVVKDVRYTSEEAVLVGDHVYYQDSGNLIGTISEITSEPATVTVIDENGEEKQIFYSEFSRINLKGKIYCRGVFGNGGFMINGTEYIAPGSKVNISTELLDVTITVIGIEAAE